MSTDLRELLTAYPSGVYSLDVFEISHSQMSKDYYLTLEPDGINIEGQFYEPANYEISLNTEKSDLDEMYVFTFSDVFNVLDDELENIDLNTEENISVIYKIYSSDNLASAQVVLNTEVFSLNQEKGKFSVICGFPRLAIRRTGVEQDYDLFPMLRAIS